MISSIGISPSAMQASAAVYNVDAVAKAPIQTRDDVVAPIDTSGGAGQADISFLKMAKPSVGQNVDIKV